MGDIGTQTVARSGTLCNFVQYGLDVCGKYSIQEYKFIIIHNNDTLIILKCHFVVKAVEACLSSHPLPAHKSPHAGMLPSCAHQATHQMKKRRKRKKRRK